MLEPREYLVLARDQEGAGAFYNVDIFGQYEGKLDNAGDTIELRDVGDVLIDLVAYDDSAPWPGEADGGGPSLELIDSGSDNSDPASWALGLPYSPGALNDPVEAGGGDVVITEIMYKPVIEFPREKAHPVGETELLQGEDPGGEYAEIFNRSGQTIDLTGWKFTDGIAFDFPAGTSIAPGAFLLIAADPAGIQRRHQQGDNVLGPYTGRLNNGGERVTLRDQDGQLVESIVFGDRYPWPVAPDEFGFSLERIDPISQGATAANWRSSRTPFDGLVLPLGRFVSRGTPGQANSMFAAAIPPFIEDLQHFPLRPLPTDEVVVSAVVSSTTPLASVVVEFSLNASEEVSTAEMFDDGAHDDGEAGDGLYAARLPRRFSQTLVHYRVRAVDPAGNETVFPYDDEPSPTLAYFHYNRDLDTQLTVYHLFLTDENLTFLVRNCGECRIRDCPPRSNEYVDASIVIDGIAYPHIATRFRGRGSRCDPKRQWNFRFNRHQLYDGNRTLGTMLNIPFVQHTIFTIVKRAGIDDLESDLIRVQLNRQFHGVYIAFESPNSAWIRKRACPSRR